MKTAEELRKQFQEETGVDPGNQIGFLAYVDWIEKRLTQQNALNRDKVEEILKKELGIMRWMNHPEHDPVIIGYERAADAICSLALPELSEVEKLISKTEDEHPYKEAGNRDSYSEYNEGWADACDVLGERFKAFLKQLTNKK